MVVRGLVRRVVRGVGSVGSPRSGGQFFQLSRRSRRLRLITLTETLIIPDITKTESNNCFIIHCFEENNDKRIIAAITVYFQTLKNVQLSDKQIFTVFIKQSSAEKLNAFLKKVSLKKTVNDQTDECLASLNVFNHKKFS